MGRHGTPRHTSRWIVAALLGVVVLGSTAVTLLVQDTGGGQSAAMTPESTCAPVRAVTSTSFAPVLNALAPALADDEECVRLDVAPVDGRTAVARVAAGEADVWIPDDAAWADPVEDQLASTGVASSGDVLATSPIYFVADPATTRRLDQAGGSWLGLAKQLGDQKMRLTVRDPSGSGDGMLAVGALGESVWIAEDMDASAIALNRILGVTRTVTGGGPALPEASGEVGLVPEYALLASREATLGDLEVRSGTDHTALLRFSWLPTSAALGNPDTAGALRRVRQALRDPAGATAIAEANLRVPGGGPPAGAPVDALPPTKARPMKVLGGHHVDHVFATWYRADRRTDLLLVVDVSGSMKQPVGGSPLINLVRQGCLSVSPLLPDDSRIGVWAFGSRLSGTRDYVERLPMRPLGQSHRRAYAAAINGLAPLETGTGLYDTILAAFTAATRAHRDGVPTQVLVFTDGINEFDAGSPSAQQFGARLEAAADPKRPVSLAVAAFGAEGPAKALEKLLEPVDGYVDVLEKPSDVPPVFVHVAAGGLHA